MASVLAGLAAPAGPAAAGAMTLAVDCAPALPYFCANIHVSCSGRTAMRTFAFRLHAQDSRGRIEAEAHAIREQYEGARVDWSEDAVILRPRRGAGYIRLLADGRYSFRHYAGDAGVMSYGHCR
jgi:hypothetical protein